MSLVAPRLRKKGIEMARTGTGSTKKAVSKVARAVKRTATKVTARLRPSKAAKAAAKTPAKAAKRTKQPAPQTTTARRKRTQPDVAPEVLENTYTPTQTSLKAPFRASGASRGRDQELAGGFSDERFKDEDRLTNKSGDPRIGTHGRTYEPGE